MTRSLKHVEGSGSDATFLATGFPACGFNSASDLRPALQALGLALEMCWAPVHVERLVEFLSHPFGPFSRRARGRLARAFSDQPGLGGDAWARAKTDIGGWEGGPAMLDEVAYWLEGERWSRKDGTPLDALIGRTEKVRGALQRRATGKDANAAAAVSAALHQCTAVLEGLAEFKRQGVPALTPRQVEQLLATSTPGGAGNPAAVAQMGCLKSATTPDTCIEAADEVLWWMPSTPALPAPLPWSTEEVAALKVLGVELRDPRQELELLAMQWLRPLLAARKKFAIVLPPPGAEEHPLCQLIKRLAPGIKVERIDEAIYGAHQDVISHTVEDVLLKPAERYIELGRPIAPRRAEQSYSSLELLFKNPAVAAVSNVAALESSASLWASRENTLLGNLAHRVVELLFQQQGALAWSDSQTLAWFDGMVDGLLAAEGINLLMQGAGVTEARFKRVCGSAICALLHHLQSAKAVRVETEVHFKGMLGTVELGGRIDLLAYFADKGIAALDLKWTRGKWFAEVLSEGKYLQLALYSHLTEQKHGIKPAALGYFVFDRGDLFVTAPDVFPTAQVRSPRNGVTTHELLEQAKASWSWRMGQWKAGTIEFVPYLDDLQEYQGDEGTLPVEKLGPFYAEEFTLLGGWEP
ncbi:PD-(D/E)XK nuclease family protein [Variovorax ureilyticus]|uniref:PD-(D/E)XK nuclease family protein n=1 Tax=Variovorax ureilyticus TaxID=1836198 RepID=A0ABU8VQZ8_9BURK